MWSCDLCQKDFCPLCRTVNVCALDSCHKQLCTKCASKVRHVCAYFVVECALFHGQCSATRRWRVLYLYNMSPRICTCLFVCVPVSIPYCPFPYMQHFSCFSSDENLPCLCSFTVASEHLSPPLALALHSLPLSLSFRASARVARNRVNPGRRLVAHDQGQPVGLVGLVGLPQAALRRLQLLSSPRLMVPGEVRVADPEDGLCLIILRFFLTSNPFSRAFSQVVSTIP